jgi:hypothetical protein
MRDRIGAVGGRLTIESEDGEGTCVSGAVPLALIDLPPQAETLLRKATDALEDRFAIYRAVRGERGIVVDFLVEHVNEAACVEMGLDRAELVGRHLRELGSGFLASEDFRWLRRVLEGGLSDSRTAAERELRAAPLGDGRLVVTWRDLSRGRHAPPTASEVRPSRDLAS